MDNTQRLRTLAARHMELACAPFMDERRLAWTKLHDLEPVRPVSILETELMEDFVQPEELLCDTPETRELERRLMHGIKHVELLEDDYVLPKALGLDAELCMTNADYGMGLIYTRDAQTHAVVTNHPLSSLDDIVKLKKRSYTYNAEKNQEKLARAQELLGEEMPVVLTQTSYSLPQVSKYVFDLIGMDNLYYWAVDCPEAIVQLADYVADDFLLRYQFMEDNNLLTTEHCLGYAGSGSLPFTSRLPQKTPVKQSEMWLWLESQETDTLSPQMLDELFLPSMARIAEKFGLIYYGCCEHLHDRMDRVLKHIPRIRAVSVSPWSDTDAMAEIIDGKMVFSRKLNPMLVYGKLNRDELEMDISHVLRAVKSGMVEFIYRDVYSWDDAQKFQECMKRIRSFLFTGRRPSGINGRP